MTGAAGFIGSHVVRELLAAGREVRAALRPGEDDRSLVGLDVERVAADVRDPDAVRAAVAGCDRVFHLAAVYALWLPDRRLMYDVNVTGTQNVLWAALRADVERVVYTSSIAAVGVPSGDTPADEATEFDQVGRTNDYVLSKWLAEEAAKGFAGNGLPLVIVNPAFPFGARDRAPTPTGQILIDVLTGRLPGVFDAGFNAVDVEDVARGHLLAEARGRVGERYLLADRNVTMREFVELVGRVAGVKVRTRRIPLRLATAVGDLLDWRADRWTRRPPRLSGAALRYAGQSLYYDNRKAREELDLSFTPIEESIRKAVEWFRAEGYVG